MNWTSGTGQLISATAAVFAAIWLIDLLLGWLAGIILKMFEGSNDVD